MTLIQAKQWLQPPAQCAMSDHPLTTTNYGYSNFHSTMYLKEECEISKILTTFSWVEFNLMVNYNYNYNADIQVTVNQLQNRCGVAFEEKSFCSTFDTSKM